MKRTIVCAVLLAVWVAPGGALGDSPTGSRELEATVAALYDEEVEERILAVQDLSGWALDGELRQEALIHLAAARFDRDRRVVLQAEVALASLTGGDPVAIRVAYGIVPPDAGELSREALEGETEKARTKALVTLGRWHGRTAIPTLLAASRDPSAAVRQQALELLQEIVDDGFAEPFATDPR